MRGKIRSGIIGSAVGDALGVPVQFTSREERIEHPIVDMIGYGTYDLPEGTWSDDTSMILATMDSLSNGISEQDLMQRFVDWMVSGAYTPFGTAFDVGATTERAIMQYCTGKDACECGGTLETDNGNGALMRMLPLAYYLVNTLGTNINAEQVLPIVHRVAGITHAHIRSQTACGIYMMIAITLIKEGNLLYAMHYGIEQAVEYYEKQNVPKKELVVYDRIRREKFSQMPQKKIKSTGYVVDTLEAVLWCLLNTRNYQDCMIMAINLGGDTDTIASIAGGLAGITYGEGTIPPAWRAALKRYDYIEEMCKLFAKVIYREGLCRLLPYEKYFQTATRSSCCTKGVTEEGKGVLAIAYPEYSSEINAFIETVENSCFWSYHYITVLNAHSLDTSEKLENAIETADIDLLSAILTGYIRQERFNEGLIATAVERKVFLRIIRSLKQRLNYSYDPQ